MLNQGMAIRSVAVFLISIFLVVLYKWESTKINLIGESNASYCIQNATNKRKLASFKSILNVNYIKNAPAHCINPHFPVIHINTETKHEAWLHVVYTDATEKKLKSFIDAPKDKKSYPFYTLERDFYDAPHWRYTIFAKPLRYWKGHAYAVQIDKKLKTIKCVGGIEWGFRLPFFHLKPKMIEPVPLNQKDWERDWQIFKEGLPEFKISGI